MGSPPPSDMPDFIRRAIEAQGKVDPDKVAEEAAAIDLDELAKAERVPMPPLPPPAEREWWDV